MESFRAMVRGWLGKTLLALVGLMMAGTGIEMYFQGSRVVAAKVNGTKIDALEVDRQTERQRLNRSCRRGGAFRKQCYANDCHQTEDLGKRENVLCPLALAHPDDVPIWHDSSRFLFQTCPAACNCG